MKKLLWLASISAVVLLVVGGATALAKKPGPFTCTGGIIPGGTYNGLNVTGSDCRFGGDVTINGNVTVADDAVLNDHAFGLHSVSDVAPVAHITGNVKVGKGAVLGLGAYCFFGPPCSPLNDTTVDGNIDANHPLDLYLSGITVHGNVISNGGGPGTSQFLNFPTKDDTIDGNLVIHGWNGGWIGIIRDTVGGNVDFSNNASVITDDGSTPPDSDSSEVQTNNVSGNLICHGNVPTAQINEGDGGAANVVGGKGIGECANERVIPPPAP